VIGVDSGFGPLQDRVRLHVAAPAVADAIRCGAALVRGVDASSVLLTDPEGTEFVLRRDPSLRASSVEQATLESADPTALARWWSVVLGARHQRVGHLTSHVTNIPGASIARLAFTSQRAPKHGVNRIHIDVTVDDIARLREVGASLRPGGAVAAGRYPLTDPEGNEFCAFPAVEVDPVRDTRL
jgi:hypothetical protein